MSRKGLKILTSQKRVVIEVVNEMNGPFTAQDVCERMAEKRSRASRATIYRMLTELSRDALIREFWLPNNKRMCVRGNAPLICVVECADCGKVEFEDPQRTSAEFGFTDAADVQTTIHRRVRCPRRQTCPTRTAGCGAGVPEPGS